MQQGARAHVIDALVRDTVTQPENLATRLSGKGVGVTVGQHVNAGDTIGFVGHTGLAAGPHLHFEVRIAGVAYDPLNFVTPR